MICSVVNTSLYAMLLKVLVVMVGLGVCCALESAGASAGFTDDNQTWLKPAKKTKLDLFDSDDDVVSIMRFILCIKTNNNSNEVILYMVA